MVSMRGRGVRGAEKEKMQKDHFGCGNTVERKPSASNQRMLQHTVVITDANDISSR